MTLQIELNENGIPFYKQLSTTASSSGGITSTAVSIPFNTVVPLTQAMAQYMPQQSVSSPLAFSLDANPVLGSSAYVRLIADGVNVPTFTGMAAFSSSSAYDNTVAGKLNVIQFAYDGTQAFYTISQETYVAPPVSATGLTLAGANTGTINVASSNFTIAATPSGGSLPSGLVITPSSTLAGAFSPATLSSAGTFTFTATALGAATITLANNKSLTNPSSLSYTVTAQPVYNAVALTGGATSGTNGVASAPFTVTLSPNGGTAPASTIVTPSSAGGVFAPTTVTLTPSTPSATFTFTPSAVGAATLAFANNQGLTNPSNVTYTASAASSFIRMTGLVSMTETGTGPYTYTGAGGNYNGSESISKSPVSFQSGVDGSFTFKLAALPTGDNAAPIFGIAPIATTVTSFSNLSFGVWTHTTGYKIFVSGSGRADTSTIPANNDLVRIVRTGSTLTIDASHDAGATWINISTDTGVSTAAMSVWGLTNFMGQFQPYASSGLL